MTQEQEITLEKNISILNAYDAIIHASQLNDTSFKTIIETLIHIYDLNLWTKNRQTISKQ